MNRAFWAGLALGAAAGALLSRVSREPEIRPAPSPVRAPDPRLQEAERKLAQAETRAKAATADAETYRNILQGFSGEHAELRTQVEAALLKDRTLKEKSDRQDRNAFLRAQMGVGKDLPEAAVSELGLTPAQRETLNTILREEGRRMVSHLRSLAAEDPGAGPLPEDGVGLMSLIGPKCARDKPKLVEAFLDPAAQDGTRTVYLDEVLGADNVYVRLMDGLERIRGESLSAATGTLNPAQMARLKELLQDPVPQYDFGGVSIGLPAPNCRPRRP